MNRHHATLEHLGLFQHGLVTRRQLIDAGWTTGQIDRAVSAGRLIVVFAGVYRIGGAPVTSDQRVLGACLAAHGAGSHRAAASVWGADLGPTPPREVILTGGSHRHPRGVVVHRSRNLDPSDVVRRRGIPVTNPMRTLVDLGAVAPREQVALALNSFTSRKLITVAAARAYREKLAGKGHRGVGVLGHVLDTRALGDENAESVLESDMAELCKRYWLPMPAYQVWVCIDGRWWRMDFAYEAEMINFEADGYEHHGGNVDRWESDLERDAAFTAAGWNVLRFSKAGIRQRPAKLAGNIHATLDRRRRSLGAA